MKHLILFLAPALLLLLAAGQPVVRVAPTAFGPDRSPADLALSADGASALTANRTDDPVSLVDLKAGRVVAEAPAGHDPFCIALARDGKTAVVTNRLGDS